MGRRQVLTDTRWLQITTSLYDRLCVKDIEELILSVKDALVIEILCAVRFLAAAQTCARARLSLLSCRRLLGSIGASMSDGDVELLRDQLYALADVVVEAAMDRKTRTGDDDPCAQLAQSLLSMMRPNR